MEQALEALNQVDNCTYINDYGDAFLSTTYESVMVDKAITALRAALAESRVEPIPIAMKTHGAWDGLELLDDLPDGACLYTAPHFSFAESKPSQPAKQPLTLWTEAQHERAYRNSPGLHKDVKSLAAFKRVAKEIAAMYGITGETK
jgi:hypothetical protein